MSGTAKRGALTGYLEAEREDPGDGGAWITLGVVAACAAVPLPHVPLVELL